MKKSKRKGIWIEQIHIEDKNLSWIDKVLITEISSLSKLKNGCTASDEHFSTLLNVTRSAVNKRINRLVKIGYISKYVHTKNKKIEGRTLSMKSLNTDIIDDYISSVLDENTSELVFPKIEVSVSNNENLVFPKIEVSVSNNENLVFPKVEVSVSRENINNTLNNSLEINQLLEQEHLKETISQNSISKPSTGISMAQNARNNINILENKIVESTERGWEIIRNPSYSTINNLQDYIHNNDEYNKVLPILKNLITEKKILFG
jgi:DNA-binding Lrp family transcriptional regulator